MKKVISLFLCAVLMLSVVSILPFSASAAIERHIDGDWEYEIWSGYDEKTYESYEEICITNYTGNDEKVSIPNEIDGKPVTYLYNNNVFGNVDSSDQQGRHFANHKSMTELTIPENLKYIAGFMLMDCEQLHTIHVSEKNRYFEFKSGVLYMKDGTKSWGDHVHYHNDDIVDEYGPVFAKFNSGVVNLPANNTTIYAYAFYNHTKLQNVTMTPAAGKMKKIEDYAFYNSGIRGEKDIMGITSVNIPWGVTEIGYSAYMYCKNLRSIHFSETLEKIGAQAFLETGCVNFHLPSNLTEVGYQAFGYSGDKVNIYGTPRVVKLVKDVTDYKPNDDTGFSGGGGAAIMITHDPANPATHIYTNSVSIAPTCTSPGLTAMLCSCGYMYYTESSVIPATGHNWKTKRVYPTCYDQGYTLHYCENCQESYQDEFKKAYNHSWKVNDPAVEPTATTAGKTAGVHCGDCGLILEPQKLIPPTGYTEKASNGVKVTAESEKTPAVTEVTDEAVIEGLRLDEDQKAEKVYDIKLTEGEETVQPEGDVIVRIPCESENFRVFRQEDNGDMTDMNAYYDEGNLVFATDHFSLYAVTSEMPKAYSLWVNNEQFTDDHLTVSCGKGSATFDPKNNILTLDNAEITQGAEIDQLYTGILDFLDEKLTIVVNGECSVTETGGDGIGSYEFDEDYQMVPHDITVTGDGRLTITESTDVYGYGFYCTGKLTLDGVDITIRSAATGIWSKELTVKNKSQILAQCMSRYSGIVVNNGSFVMEDSNVVAESTEGLGLLLGNDQDSSALMLSSGYLTLKGAVGIGSDAGYSRVAVTGGTLTVESQLRAVSESITGKENGIFLGDHVEVVSGGCEDLSVVISDGVEPQPERLVGDADSNGIVNVGDATYIQMAIARMILDDDGKPFDFNALDHSSVLFKAADVDSNGSINVGDATYIQMFAAHMTVPDAIGKPVR